VDYCAYESSEKARSEMWENAEKIYIRTLMGGEWEYQLKTYKNIRLFLQELLQDIVAKQLST